MKLAVGTVVVYPPHGVGRIAALERRVVLGVEQDTVMIELAEGLSVMLPLERAQTLLRPLVTEAGLQRVGETLREDRELSDDIWSKRLKDVQEKLRKGDPAELAEIVRDCARRDNGLTASGAATKLSASERALFVKARELLSREIRVARGVDQAAADAWIDEQLAPLGR